MPYVSIRLTRGGEKNLVGLDDGGFRWKFKKGEGACFYDWVARMDL